MVCHNTSVGAFRRGDVSGGLFLCLNAPSCGVNLGYAVKTSGLIGDPIGCRRTRQDATG